MAAPVLFEGYGLAPTLVVLITMTLVFVISEVVLVSGENCGLGFVNNLAAAREIQGWRADKMADDSLFLGTVCYLVPILEARVQRARQLRLRSDALREQHRRFLSKEIELPASMV